MKVTMSDLSLQLSQIQPKLEFELHELFENAKFIGGPYVERFESSFADYVGTKFAIGVANGTDSLEIALQALDLPRSSTVLVPANSFAATAEAVLNTGLNLELVEVGEDYGFDKDYLISRLGPHVSAVIAVHLFGHPQELDWLSFELNQRGIYLIEDCAQAHGAEIDGKKVGTIGVFGSYSFYPGKNLGAIGDAGALVTNDPELAKRARRIANHGRMGKFDHEVLGRNSRLDALQAIVLHWKLKELDSWNSIRRENAKIYRAELAELDQLTLPPKSVGKDVYHHFVIRTKSRDDLRNFLTKNSIESGIHYPESIDSLPPFMSYSPSPMLRARNLAKHILSLPIAEHLGAEQILYVSKKIKEFFESN